MVRRIVTLLFVALVAESTFAQQRPLDAAQIQLALKKLTVVGSAMYIAAHPDDENTAFIAWLSDGRLYRTAYLSMTRGDGGQNLLGDEKGELLGVIRTQELLAARRIDGSEQYFTRALDFGYSKNPAETLAIWGHDTILADVVWNIRRFQPDVLVTRFPTTGEGGHGHHTASAILAGEAFKDAADPTKFPEQLTLVKVWQPRRLFWNHFSFRPVEPTDPSVAKSLRVDIGSYNPILGRAYSELAAESRSMHKSQGFGSSERRGTFLNYFDELAGDPATTDLFEGINTTWSRYPGYENAGRLLQQASDTFDEKDPAKSVPILLEALTDLEKVPLNERPPIVRTKIADLEDAIRACAGISIDVQAADSMVVPGNELPVSVTVINRSDIPFRLMGAGATYTTATTVDQPLKNNVPVKVDVKVRVPADAKYSQPYWLQEAPAKGAFTVKDQRLIGLAENPPPISLFVQIQDEGHLLDYSVPAVYHWTDAVRGEQTRRVDIVPDVTANLGAPVYVFPDTKPKPLTVWLQNNATPTSAKVKLQLPAGWSATPAVADVNLEGKGDEQHVTFSITPPANDSTGTAGAEITLANGRVMTLGVTNIDYPHIPAQRVFGDSAAKLVRADIRHKGNRVGYIMGAGDDVPEALRQIGYDVSLLSDADLERGDFAKFDAIVTGVRAYNTRKRLKIVQPKLMQYVENGGTLVVQYNSTSPQPLLIPSPGPYPFKVTTDRVTVEEAPVKVLAPDSPLLTTPNKITDADWKDWVQERGLYFLRDWDPKYQTVIETHDPNEPEKPGGELYTRYGKGVFIYTSYAWFRQLPAGVPGAYRLFANLVSAK